MWNVDVLDQQIGYQQQFGVSRKICFALIGSNLIDFIFTFDEFAEVIVSSQR